MFFNRKKLLKSEFILYSDLFLPLLYTDEKKSTNDKLEQLDGIEMGKEVI